MVCIIPAGKEENMGKVNLEIKLESEVKEKAEELAESLGITLEIVLAQATRDFVRRKCITICADDAEDIY